MQTQVISSFLFGTCTVASPLLTRQASNTTYVLGDSQASENINIVTVIEAIMPKSTSCEGAEFPNECRTAEQAAPFVAKALIPFSNEEKAALLALMGFESVDFRYKHNVFPGVEGQGTANMMMPKFVTEYASDLFGDDEISGKSLSQILAMVTLDDYNFGSAGWFLVKHCDHSVRDVLKTGTDAGWNAYMSCVGVNGSDQGRMAYWIRAKQAFGF